MGEIKSERSGVVKPLAHLNDKKLTNKILFVFV
jgi:hypothetical protein